MFYLNLIIYLLVLLIKLYHENDMEIIDYISYGIGIAGISIIAWGVLVIFAKVIHLEFKMLKGRKIFREREALRHQLGSYLLLGLEFLIAADIIYTISYPTLNDVIILGSIVLIRTVISYSLDRDIAESYTRKENEKAKTK